MHTRLRQWLPWGKRLLAGALIAFVAWHFARDLGRHELAALTVRPLWLTAAGVLYLLGLCCWAGYWLRLLRAAGTRPHPLAVLRGYFVGMLGKYIPGKALALPLRAGLVAAPQLPFGLGLLTAFYEVLTSMAAGALLAALLCALDPPAALALSWHPALLGGVLLLVIAVPLWPGLFNRLLARLARRYPEHAAWRAPPLGLGVLLQGLVIGSAGWWLLGLSHWALVQAILPEPQPLSFAVWAQYTALTSLAYVAGFVVLIAPGGVGVRELVLEQLLIPLLETQEVPAARATAVVAVLLLRVLWTAAEVGCAGVLYLVPNPHARAVHPKPES